MNHRRGWWARFKDYAKMEVFARCRRAALGQGCCDVLIGSGLRYIRCLSFTARPWTLRVVLVPE